MSEWFAGIDVLEKVYFACAVFGGLVFGVRLVTQLLGADSHDAAGGISDAPADLHPAGDSDLSFKLLSIQGVAAFFLIFGLTGMALKELRAAGDVQSIAIAAGAGCAMTYVQAKFMTMLFKLQSSGNLRMEEAEGREGVVYLTIKTGGAGKAQVVVQGRRKIFDAVGKDGAEIKTGARVRVTEISPGNVLVVERVA